MHFCLFIFFFWSSDWTVCLAVFVRIFRAFMKFHPAILGSQNLKFKAVIRSKVSQSMQRDKLLGFMSRKTLLKHPDFLKGPVRELVRPLVQMAGWGRWWRPSPQSRPMSVLERPQQHRAQLRWAPCGAAWAQGPEGSWAKRQEAAWCF